MLQPGMGEARLLEAGGRQEREQGMWRDPARLVRREERFGKQPR